MSTKPANKKVKTNNAKKNQNKKLVKPTKVALRAKAINRNLLATPVNALVLGQGVLKEIPVAVVVNSNALAALPCALVTMALVNGGEDPFAFYKTIYSDVVSIIQGTASIVNSRLQYQNEIYGSLTPKTVPYKYPTELSYSYLPFDNDPPDEFYDVRGKKFYMYVPIGGNLSFELQGPPPAYSLEQQLSIYSDSISLLAGTKKHNQVIRNTNLSPEYLRDSSAFARNSPYYGQGAYNGSPYGSVESEVPFKSNLLGCLTSFDSLTPRSSRNLRITSGDMCSNFGIGALDAFDTDKYQGAVPPIYKFLDINELGYIMATSLAQALTLIGNTGNAITTTYLTTGFPFTWGAFILMLRRQLMYMFSDSQALGQFMVPDNAGNGAFEALRMGSNAFPTAPVDKLKISAVLNENLRMLKMSMFSYTTAKRNNPRNVVTHIPVWGAFKTYSPPIVIYFPQPQEPAQFFSVDPQENLPDLWDGTWGNNVADLNRSDLLDNVLEVWNELTNACSGVFGTLDSLGGDGSGSSLLQFTRYVDFTNFGEQQCELPDKEVRRMTSLDKMLVKEKEIEVSQGDKRSSKKEIKKFKVFAPPENSVQSEYSRFISGSVPITPTHRAYLSSFILPIIEINSGDNIPGYTQTQVATMEPYAFSIVNRGLLTSRSSEIISTIPDHVVGIAGHLSPFAQFVINMSNQDQGGFFGDLFATAGNIANSLGFTGAGAIAGVASNVANSLNV